MHIFCMYIWTIGCLNNYFMVLWRSFVHIQVDNPHKQQRGLVVELQRYSIKPVRAGW